MVTKLGKIYFLIIFIVSFYYGGASNYYFSTEFGNDSRSFVQAQNPLTPWKTIDKLNTILSSIQAGDSILFKRGEVFYGGVKLFNLNTGLTPIVFSSYGDGTQPVISGLKTLSGWTQLGNGIYESSIPINSSDVNMVIINGTNYAMGRYPNEDANNGGYLNFELYGNDYITDNELPAESNWVGSELVIRTLRWQIERTPIITHVGSSLFFDPSNSFPLTEGFGYFIQKSLKTLDQFGEWFFDPSTQKLYVFFGINSPAESTVQVATIDILINARASNIVLDDLSLMGANKYAVFNDWGGMENFRINNCKILFSGIDGVHFSGQSNFSLKNSSILNSNSCGVNLSFRTPNAHLENNVIENTGLQVGMLGNQSYAVSSSSVGFRADNNTIINSGYIGIRADGDSILIKNNYIDTFCTILDDGAGIYTWTGFSGNIFFNRRIIQNVVMNGVGAGEGTNNLDYLPAEGIYLDDNSANVEISGNTIANCANSGIYVHNSNKFSIKNNTLFNNQTQLLATTDREGYPITGGQVSGNIFFSKENTQKVSSYILMGNNFDEMGAFSSNYYARPLDDKLTISTEYLDEDQNRLRKAYALEDWQSIYSIDQGSKKSPIILDYYSIVSVDEANKCSNGSFDSDIEESFCWSPSNGCVTSWTSGPLDGGLLEVSDSGPSILTINCGKIENNKQYLLRFSAVAQQDLSLEVSLRKEGLPWTIISETWAVKIDQSRKEYELLFSFPSFEEFASIEFYSGNENITYWLDNIGLFEASASLIDPNDHIRFEYNPTQSPITIPLDTSYVDVKNTPYVGSVTLAPFKSVILMESDVITSVLPVDLSAFYSLAEDCEHIAVHWTADLEENFSHYELEKSYDGLNYEVIHQTRPEAFPPPVHYKYLDPEAKKQNYYRLKMVDLDGSMHYSKIIIQQTDCPGAIPDWELYPNPVKDSTDVIHIRFYTQNRAVNLKMLDQFGREVKQLQANTSLGWNTLTWQVNGLSPGIYIIYDTNSRQSKALRLIVTH